MLQNIPPLYNTGFLLHQLPTTISSLRFPYTPLLRHNVSFMFYVLWLVAPVDLDITLHYRYQLLCNKLPPNFMA